MNEGKVVGGEPVVARRYPTTLFDPVEEPLDLVARAIEIGAEADRIAAIAFRRDVGRPSRGGARVTNDSGVVRLARA
jgi:hypothetical protein